MRTKPTEQQPPAEKIRLVRERPRGEHSTAEPCRREGIPLAERGAILAAAGSRPWARSCSETGRQPSSAFPGMFCRSSSCCRGAGDTVPSAPYVARPEPRPSCPRLSRVVRGAGRRPAPQPAGRNRRRLHLRSFRFQPRSGRRSARCSRSTRPTRRHNPAPPSGHAGRPPGSYSPESAPLDHPGRGEEGPGGYDGRFPGAALDRSAAGHPGRRVAGFTVGDQPARRRVEVGNEPQKPKGGAGRAVRLQMRTANLLGPAFWKTPAKVCIPSDTSKPQTSGGSRVFGPCRRNRRPGRSAESATQKSGYPPSMTAPKTDRPAGTGKRRFPLNQVRDLM